MLTGPDCVHSRNYSIPLDGCVTRVPQADLIDMMRLQNLLNPSYIAGRIRHTIYERRHPDHPWISPGSIQWLDRHLRKDMRGFEWGSGRSTSWFAQRLDSITSIENDEAWHDTVLETLRVSGLQNVTLKFIPVEHEFRERYSPYYPELPAYVSAIEIFPAQSLDFVVVDGHYRQPCIWAALSKIKLGGYLLVDNTDWLLREYWPVPFSWEMVHRSQNALTQTTIWQKPHCKNA